MARILEHISKELLGQHGVAVPQSGVATDPESALGVAEQIGYPVVVKALVTSGKRGKAGAVRFVDEPAALQEAVSEILKLRLDDYPIEQVLVEQKLPIAQELFLSISIDTERFCPVILVSGVGGVDIEELVRNSPESLLRWPVDSLADLSPGKARELWARAGLSGLPLRSLGNLLSQTYRAFRALDATLLEINPVALLENGQAVAAATVLSVDDAALFRQPDLRDRVTVGLDKVWHPPTELEQQATLLHTHGQSRGSARYLELESGDIGFVCGGGGASLVLFDCLVAAGGQPANYAEIGGNPTADKVRGLTRIVLSKPGVKGLFVAHSITNNTQVDVLAEGVVGALRDVGLDGATFPVVVREAGVGQERGAAIFKAENCHYYDEHCSLAEAAAHMVEAMQERGKRQ
jgi:succinyl-CoA synthetase beta subunit/citryl-CoA synthetase large subunit